MKYYLGDKKIFVLIDINNQASLEICKLNKKNKRNQRESTERTIVS